MNGESEKSAYQEHRQFSTFTVAKRLYGIDVIKVQEVVRPMAMTQVPLAPVFVKGLINLRGQVATAIGLRELFHLPVGDDKELMNVVCQYTGSIISLLVDEIGDVIEVSQRDFEPTPQTIPDTVKQFMKGVYKVSDTLLSVLDLDTVLKFVNKKK
jgi:purine-binding chemotaxis protein CheW